MIIPAFITVIMMLLTSSGASGIALGFILYPITMIAKGRAKELHPLLYVLFAAFLAYFIYL